jgi:hypothetical protein
MRGGDTTMASTPVYGSSGMTAYQHAAPASFTRTV